MADQVAVLRQGTVQQVGSPTEIYDHPANRWVATFVGSPRMNLLKCKANGRLEGEGWSLPNPGFGIQGDRPALFGVRSEDLSLDVREESATLEGKVYAVEPLGDRTLVDIEVGEQRRDHQGRRRPRRTRSARRSAPRSTWTASTCSTPTRSRRSRRHDRRPATASSEAGADPRACPARRRRLARGARVRARRLAGHRPPRPRAALGRGAARAGARRRALAAGHAAADRDGMERARARGRAREGLDRASARGSWSRTGRRSSSTRPRRGWRSRGRSSCGRRPS